MYPNTLASFKKCLLIYVDLGSLSFSSMITLSYNKVVLKAAFPKVDSEDALCSLSRGLHAKSAPVFHVSRVFTSYPIVQFHYTIVFKVFLLKFCRGIH